MEFNLEIVKANIKSFPNFPKDGINFKDIFAVLRNPKSLKALIELVQEKARYFLKLSLGLVRLG
jgi:adenine/guanine phosphoribosyltransferase-like PRPP-binding protein